MAASKLDAQQMLDREFLEIRCRLIDIAASLDRIDRREGSERAHRDARYLQIREAVKLLSTVTSPRQPDFSA